MGQQKQAKTDERYSGRNKYVQMHFCFVAAISFIDKVAWVAWVVYQYILNIFSIYFLASITVGIKFFATFDTDIIFKTKSTQYNYILKQTLTTIYFFFYSREVPIYLQKL